MIKITTKKEMHFEYACEAKLAEELNYEAVNLALEMSEKLITLLPEREGIGAELSTDFGITRHDDTFWYTRLIVTKHAGYTSVRVGYKEVNDNHCKWAPSYSFNLDLSQTSNPDGLKQKLANRALKYYINMDEVKISL